MATVWYDLPTQPLMLQAVVGDDAINYNASDVRLMLGALYPRPGRIGLGDALFLYPRAAGANWSLDVQAGQAVIASNSNAYAPERYLVTLPARTNLSLIGFNTAPTVTRTHKVWIAVDDKSTSGTTYKGRIIVTEDTGAGAPDPVTSFFTQIGTVQFSPGQSNITAGNLDTIMLRASHATYEYEVTDYHTGYVGGNGVGGQELRFSLDGNTVRLQGCVQRESGVMSVGTVYNVARMPIGYRPDVQRLGVAASHAPCIARVVINADGQIEVHPYAANVADMTYVSFDGVSYELH